MACTVIPTADLEGKKGGKAYAEWMEVAAWPVRYFFFKQQQRERKRKREIIIKTYH